MAMVMVVMVMMKTSSAGYPDAIHQYKNRHLFVGKVAEELHSGLDHLVRILCMAAFLPISGRGRNPA